MYCDRLIAEANEKFSSQYRGELANHLPMDLVALERLGATPERLTAYRDHYVRRLEPRSQTSEIEICEDNWQSFLGQNKYHAEYLKYFKDRLDRQDFRRVLRNHVPTLFRGVGGGAFHGLIRLGYALDTQSSEEIMQALAYWSISYLELKVESKGQTKEPKEIFAELNAAFHGFKPDASNIARRMEIIAELEQFQTICSQVRIGEDAYKLIAPLVLALFLQTQDFTALHAVTSTHAFRIVSRYLAEDVSIARDLFIALAAAYVSIRAPKVEGLDANLQVGSWDQLAQKAIGSDDDHIPKIVFSCQQEFLANKNAAYFAAADRYVTKFI